MQTFAFLVSDKGVEQFIS